MSPIITFAMSKNQGYRQYSTILDWFVKAAPRRGKKMNPNNKYTKELTIQSKLSGLLLVKRQQLKQKMIISGYVRTQTFKLQLAIAVGMPMRMKLFVMFIGYVDTLIINTHRASKKGKYTTELSFIRPNVSPYPTKISNIRYSSTNLYFFLDSFPLSYFFMLRGGLDFSFGSYGAFMLFVRAEGTKAKFCIRKNWELFSTKFSQVVLTGGGSSSRMNSCSNILRWSSCYFNFILYVKIGYLIEYL